MAMHKPALPRSKAPVFAKTTEARQTGEQVQSLMRGLALLEAFADLDGKPLGLNELALRTGLSPSTAHRLLASLHAEGYVTRDRETNRYVLGHRIAGTAATIQQRTSHLRCKLTAAAVGALLGVPLRRPPVFFPVVIDYR